MTSRILSIPVRTVTVLAIVGAMTLAGCGKKDATPEKAATAAPPAKGTPVAPPTAPTDREIKITSIKPDGGTLKTGETVKLAISAAYTLPAQGGGVGIVVQDSKNALIANKLTQVAGGSGTVAEEIEFKVPATERIVVHVPLYLKDETKSSTVASREFKVNAK
jgi:type IV pilus biogenesis protein CpaD/CtpE